MANSAIYLSFLLFLFAFYFSCGQIQKYSLPVYERHAEIDVEKWVAIDNKRATYIIQGNLAEAPPISILPIAGGYVAKLIIGSFEQEVSLIIDPGSPMVWWQCKCYADNCFESNVRIYDYRSFSFGTVYCDDVERCKKSENNFIFCHNESSTDPSATEGREICMYGMAYGDGDRTMGGVASEYMKFQSYKNYRENITFGCGEFQRGLFYDPETSGILGLSDNSYSLANQIKATIFSVCLPARFSNQTSTLDFNKIPWPMIRSVVSTIVYNPLPNSAGFYYVLIKEIRVGNEVVDVPPSIWGFDRGGQGSVVDLGTVLTYLPNQAYIKLRDLFRRKVHEYETGLTPAIVGYRQGFDTCYRISHGATLNAINVPMISIKFDDGAVYTTYESDQVLTALDSTSFCLAFKPNMQYLGNMTILGSILFQGVRVYFSRAPPPLRLISFESQAC